MNVQQHSSPTDFLDITRDYLEQEEAVNGLLLGLTEGLVRGPRRRRNRPFLATVTHNNALQLVALQTPPRKMVLNSHHREPNEATAALALFLQAKGKSMTAVLGPAEVADSFAKQWGRLGEGKTAVTPGIRQRVYAASEIIELPKAKGYLRIANGSDLPLITEWIFGFYEDVQQDQDISAAQMVAVRMLSDESIFVWDHQGPVSMAAKSRPTRHGISVNLVYTPQDLRGNGYATACVARLSRKLLKSGYSFCTLFTDLSNPVSNHVYQKIGYRPMRDFSEHFFSTAE